MTTATARRSVDWTVILDTRKPMPVLLDSPKGGELVALLSAFNHLLSAGDTDALLRRAVEIARANIGLERVGIFVLDESGENMLGTWGSDLQGRLVDEHHVAYEFDASGAEVFRRAEAGDQHYSVLTDCPIVVQRPDFTEVAGRGWVCCTPIRSARARIGMMFNDSGLSGRPADDSKQVRAAMLCSLLGNLIELARARPVVGSTPPSRRPVKQPTVQKAVEMLANDPSLSGKEIAAVLGISISRLVRVFKFELGVSIVEYRNRLRLDRFQALVAAGENNLFVAARAAGFGSYAQFYRVFREVYGASPSAREFVPERP